MSILKQTVYGNFEPNFLGVSLSYPFGEYERFQSIWNSSDPDKVIWKGDQMLNRNPEKAVQFFSLATAVTHEIRHFYDFFLSPIGNFIFRIKLACVFNGIQLLPCFKKLIVPVPLTIWLDKKTYDQQEYINNISYLITKKVFTEFDKNDDCIYHKMLMETQKNYSTLEQLRKYSCYNIADTELTDAHLFESSAIICQAQEIYNIFGLPHAEFFLSYLMKKKLSYTLVIKTLCGIWDNIPLIYTLSYMNAVISFCLLSNIFDENDKNNSPISRFIQIVKLLLKYRSKVLNKLPSELLCDWIEIFYKKDVKDIFNSTEKRNGTLYKTFSEVADKDNEFSQKILHTFRNFIELHKYIRYHYLSNIDNYLVPYNFNNDKSIWFVPPIITRLYGGGLLFDKDKFEKNKIYPIEFNESNNKKFVTIYLKNVSNQKIINTDIAIETLTYMNTTDYLFYKYRRNDQEYTWTKKILKLIFNIDTIELF